jgi:uncharacterized protein YbaA (DUF1428 family)
MKRRIVFQDVLPTDFVDSFKRAAAKAASMLKGFNTSKALSSRTAFAYHDVVI